MFRRVTESIDRWVIRSACASTAESRGAHRAAEAMELLQHPEYLRRPVPSAVDLSFSGKRDFQFPSVVNSRWPENNLVRGKLYQAGPNWREKPSIVLLHGWNGEIGYYWQFPWLAWRLARSGINAAMIELPYHAQRKPGPGAEVRNFISHDLCSMVEATEQATLDTRALMSWLSAQGSPAVGLWGISLGAWLAGLISCIEPATKFTVLMCPIVHMERAVMDLPFCEPIRRSLQNGSARSQLNGSAPKEFNPDFSLQFFNLVSYRPLLPPENILIIESRYDLFANVRTIEELWEEWKRPQIWRLPHGHISVLASLLTFERIVKWLVKQSKPSLH